MENTEYPCVELSAKAVIERTFDLDLSIILHSSKDDEKSGKGADFFMKQPDQKTNDH